MRDDSIKVGIACWDEDDEIGEMILDAFIDLGYSTKKLLHDSITFEQLDVVLAYGPFGSLVPIANQLLAVPSPQRPLFVLWMTEQFANPNIPEGIRYWGGIFRSYAERQSYHQLENGTWIQYPKSQWITNKFHRYRYYGDLFWLQQKGILSILAIASPWTANFLRTRGFNPLEAYPGLCQECGDELNIERDIPVLWLGKTGSNRRKQILKSIREELRKQEIDLLMIDGVEHPYVFGDERINLLNRSKIVLNILRQEWDDNSMRYCFAALNRSLIISEPTLRHTLLVPGEHLIELPIEQISDGITYYLSHEDERQQFVDRAYHLVTSKMTMHQGVKKIIEQIKILREQ